jgi:hypothetical protein
MIAAQKEYKNIILKGSLAKTAGIYRQQSAIRKSNGAYR